MSAMSEKLMTVFGGTGFLGRNVVREGLAAGWDVRIAARAPRPGLLAAGPVQAELFAADIRDPGAVASAVQGASAVVNAVSLYVENRQSSFESIHVHGAGHVARAAKQASARLVQVSGIGVDRCSRSPYIRARALGEERVRDIYPDTTVLRPSALFGSGDALLSTLTAMVNRLPVIPLFGAGDSRIQPAAVDDVSRAVVAALERADARAGMYELGGPVVYTYRQLFEGIATRLGRRRWFIPVPYMIWNLAAVVVSALPAPPVTRDQIELVRRDNVVTGGRTFRSLGMDNSCLTNILDAVPGGGGGHQPRRDP